LKNPKADEAYKLYKDGMKLLEIADRLEYQMGQSDDGKVRIHGMKTVGKIKS